MNEDSGGTPNPLNPNPTQPTQKVQVNPAQMTPDGNVLVPSLDPDGRPMVQVPTQVETPPKEKKTGLIIGIIVAVIAVIGGGIAAAILLLGGRGDAVAAAVDKITSGNMPANVSVDGTIDLVYDGDYSPISEIKLNFGSDVVTKTMANSSKVSLEISTFDGDDYEVELDDVYTDSGNLYFKIAGVSDILSNSDLIDLFINGGTEYPTNDCLVKGSDGECIDIVEGCASESYGCYEPSILYGETTNDGIPEELSLIAGIFEVVDDEWLRISASDLSQYTDSDAMDWLSMTGNLSCFVDLANNASKGGSGIIELYRKDPFISSTDKDIPVKSVKDPIYKIDVDNEKFANYLNTIQDNELIEEAFDCAGITKKTSITANDITEIGEALPAVYAEVDKDNNFTRLYTEYSITDGEDDGCYCPEDAICSTCIETDSSTLTIKVDFRFSYPSSLEIKEPSDYTDFSDMITQIMMGLFMSNNIEEVDY